MIGFKARPIGAAGSWVIEDKAGRYVGVVPTPNPAAAQTALQFAASGEMRDVLLDAAGEFEYLARVAADPDTRARFRRLADRSRAALRRCLTTDPPAILTMVRPAACPDGVA